MEHLNPWDGPYYAVKLEQETCAISDEELRPYFSVKRLWMDSLSWQTNSLVFQFKRIAGERTGTTADAEYQIWHDDVRVYKIHDEDGSYIGVFYADLFPREGKRGGAWMNPLYTHTSEGGIPRSHRIDLW